MAEARTEEEEENSMRDNLEPAVRRAAGTNRGRPDRRKPEHRLSQGPLSSIRAAIKRTSTRSTSLSETPRDQDRDRQRDRRRPEITILSAEPLASTSWFPAGPGGFPPPPPPPAAQIWGATIPPAIQPPPSYEDVIREKTQEQVAVPSSSSPSHPISTTTIATQTDTGAGPGPPDSPVQRPTRPPRPPPPGPSRPSHVDEVAPDRSPPRPQTVSASTSCCDLLGDPCAAAVPTDRRDPEEASPSIPPERPKPRPRSKPGVRPIGEEVRVQTLVKLREDGLATLAAARSGGAAASQESCRGKYLQELLEAFGADDWGFPDRRSDSSRSDSEEEEEGEEEEDMAALRARIQAFEQQAADAKCGQSSRDPSTKPEPRPRPSKSSPPAIAPKPKTPPKPSSKVFWEEETAPGTPVDPAEPSPEGLTHPDPSTRKTGGKPPVTPKPQLAQRSPAPAPVPAPRPPPPKQVSNPKPPPRPSVTPRTSPGAPPQDKTTPTPSPRTSAEVCSAARTGSDDSRTAPEVSPEPAEVSSTPLERSDQDSTEPFGPPGPPGPATPPSVPAAVCSNGSVREARPEPARPARTPSVKLFPLRPPPIKSHPERPPPPAFGSTSSSTKRVAALPGPGHAPPATAAPPSRPSPPPATANHTQAPKKGPPLPPRPKPGHPLYSSSMKQEVLIILDDPSPAPSDPPHQPTLVSPPQCLLDLDCKPEPIVNRDGRSGAAPEGLGPPDSQCILPEGPVERKEEPDPQLVSGPRCVAVFDYEGEEDDELTFSQGDVIALLELVDREWGRGLIHGRAGIFPLSFTEVLEGPDPSGASPDSEVPAGGEEEEEEEWDTALFDFPGQTADDLSFQKGALIRVVEHVDAQWRRGRLDGREGLYPAAFAGPARPIRGRPAGGGASAKAVFDFTAENEDELTLKVGDVVRQVEPLDQDWISGVVGGKRGIVPRSYVSPDPSAQ